MKTTIEDRQVYVDGVLVGGIVGDVGSYDYEPVEGYPWPWIRPGEQGHSCWKRMREVRLAVMVAGNAGKLSKRQ